MMKAIGHGALCVGLVSAAVVYMPAAWLLQVPYVDLDSAIIGVNRSIGKWVGR